MIIAYRVWEVGLDGLLHPYSSTPDWFVERRPPAYLPWTPGANRAICRVLEHHEPPERVCSCGFWGLKDPRRLPVMGCFRPARGAVSLWGNIVEHELGYRAQYAMVHSLALTYDPGEAPELLKLAAQIYDVPIVEWSAW